MAKFGRWRGRSPLFLNAVDQKDNLKPSPVDVKEGLIRGLNQTGLVLGVEGLECVCQGASSSATEEGQHINYKNAFWGIGTCYCPGKKYFDFQCGEDAAKKMSYRKFPITH